MALKTKEISWFDEKFMKEVNDQVNHSMTPLEAEYEKASASTTPHHFRDILGASDDAYWWRLYINPQDWENALKLPDPRLLYNTDAVEERSQPKGFREGMTASYKKYLIDETLRGRFGPRDKPLTADDYIQIFKDTAPHLRGDQVTDINKPHQHVEPLEFRDEDMSPVTFGSPDEFAADVFDIQFDVTRRKAASSGTETVSYTLLKADSRTDTFACWWTADRNTVAPANGSILKQGITGVFKAFQKEIAGAKKRSEQLQAIARAVRSLHIMHAFTNGCGRINIFTVLPLLLLRYGFGLPLGGQYGQNVSKRAIFAMFNGGYSVEQMARYLYVTQDLGLLWVRNGVLSVPSCLGVKGQRPIPPGHHVPAPPVAHPPPPKPTNPGGHSVNNPPPVHGAPTGVPDTGAKPKAAHADPVHGAPVVKPLKGPTVLRHASISPLNTPHGAILH